MLKSLRIQNIAIIDNQEFDFKNGLTVFTGESGAGKSIIIHAIELLCGKAAQDHLIRNNETSAFVEGIFALKNPKNTLLKDYCEDEQIIITRLLNRNKKSIARINGQSVPIKTLKKITESLLNIVSQHDHVALKDPNVQLALIDEGHKQDLKKYQEIYSQWQTLLSKENTILSAQTDAQAKLDFLTFQIDDIKKEGFLVDEEIELNTQKNHYKKSQTLTKHYKALNTALGDIQNTVNTCQKEIETLIEKNEALEKESNALDTIQTQLDPIIDQVISKSRLLGQNTTSIDDIEARLDTIFKYKTKYKTLTLNALIEKLDHLETDKKNIETADASLKELKKDISQAHKTLLKIGKTLHANRKKAAETIEKKLALELKDLNLDHVRVKFSVTRYDETPFSNGLDRISIEFSPNPGAPFHPIEKIASGGEQSRVMLALRNVTTPTAPHCTYIFDEVDSGIGGLTAIKVGEKLKSISEKHPVICITHLAQIAKFCDTHIAISKEIQDNTVSTLGKALDTNESLAELKRMMGGEDVTSLVSNM